MKPNYDGVYTFNSCINSENFETLYSSNNNDVINFSEITLPAMNFEISDSTPSTFNLNMNTTNHLWKYDEDKILKDIQEYVTGTYKSHYCGQEANYKDIQTIDLMAAKELAANFCQANILKYGSRYGSKDGKSKQDLMKVIHYAMLLLHFDGHYTRTNNGLNEFR